MSRRTCALLILVLLLLATAATAGIGAVAAPAPQRSSAAARHWTVTLITGQRVLVSRDAGGKYGASVIAGGGDIQTVQTGEHLYVVPSSVTPLLGSTLDRELFDVRALVEQGLDDAHSARIPVLVAQRGAESGARLEAGSGDALDAKRALPHIGLVTGAVVKSHGKALLAGLERRADAAPTAGGRGVAGVAHIWLDRRVHAAWDHNLEQLAAPQAWAGGYDGRGVRIAVLDTGIDAGHPDFAGKIVASEDFSGKGSVADGAGHGTHVAGLAAGSGAGNSGERRGVAPEASLLIGKVLDDTGDGDESQVLAGMEWAAAQGADVVSMSLGIGPTDGSDPMSMAVNRLSVGGPLFVVAAGNFHDPMTVASPAAADAALAVAAVDGDDHVADFSSRGPRLGDAALKPDVAAPGVDVVSARAEGTGEPPEGLYTTLSGTSMATPQVAGAAALLFQRHPDWTPDQVKAALAGTADPTAGVSPVDQGAGRIDVAEALAATVVPEDEDADLGLLRYPQTGAATTTAAWRNDGDAAVTLDLALDLHGPDGAVPTLEQAHLSASSVTVPPGGHAHVTLTVDPRTTTPGQYAGYLTATERGTGEVLNTPVGFADEPESYDLTIHGINRAGNPPTFGSSFDVIDVEDVQRFGVFWGEFREDGTATLRVPAGEYYVDAQMLEWRGDERDTYAIGVEPQVKVAADTTVTLDARDYVRADSRVAGVPTALDYASFTRTFIASLNDGLSIRNGFDGGYARSVFVPRVLPPISKGTFESTIARRHLAPRVTLRSGRVLRTADACQGSPLPPAGRLRAVDVGAGSAEEFAAHDLHGRLAVARRGLPLDEIASRAKEAGAALLALVNDRPGLFFGPTFCTLDMPTLTVDGRDARLLEDGARIGVRTQPASPFTYDLYEHATGGFPTRRTYSRQDQRRLARVDAHYPNEPGTTIQSFRQFEGALPGDTTPVGRAKRTEYVTPDVDVTWNARRTVWEGDHGWQTRLEDDGSRYRPGQRATGTWFGAPLGAGLAAAFPVTRAGDTLAVAVRNVVDEAGHFGWIYEQPFSSIHELTRLFRDGELLAEQPFAVAEFEVPAERAHYRLESETDSGPGTPLHTRTRIAWEFESAHVDGEQDVGLADIRFGALRGRRMTVRTEPAQGRPRFWYSLDDGATWHDPRRTRAAGEAAIEVELPRLPHGAVVSLRAETGSVSKEVIRAVSG